MRTRLNAGWTRLDRACSQRLKLKNIMNRFTRTNCSFNFNLRRYFKRIGGDASRVSE